MVEEKWVPIICVDFDGVLHSYTSGWKGIDNIPDPPVPRAMSWLACAVLSEKAEIHVYSSRSKDLEGVVAMRRWLGEKLTDMFEMEHDHLCDEFFTIYPKLLDWIPREFRGRERRKHVTKAAGHVLDMIQFPTQKPAASMTIDDRAHCFMGRFRPIEWYLNFRPWNKRSPEEGAPDYAQSGAENWNQDDEDLADQALECLLDCLTVDRDGFYTFEASALEYMASMFMEARKTRAITKETRGPVEKVREVLFEVLQGSGCSSKCLDDKDDRNAVLEEVLHALLTRSIL